MQGVNAGGNITIIESLSLEFGSNPELKEKLLNDSLKKYRELFSVDCQLLIELTKTNKDDLYAVQIWLVHSSKEFEMVHVRDKPINLYDVEETTQFVINLFEIIDQMRIDHSTLTLEFILPIELFSHPIEQWLNEDNDPIGALYPILVRSQERFCHSKLQRFWKPIQPDLNESLSNKTYWLEQPHAKTFHSKLKEHICFAMAFNPCHIEEQFLKEMLKYGVAVGLWAHKCQDFCFMKQQVSNEIFNNKSLCDLPTALKDFRVTQWDTKQYDYHLTLFWDDKDRIPPSYQLQIPD